MNKRIQKLLSVLVAVLLLLSALPLCAFAEGGSTDITAKVRNERTLTILPHTHGELLYIAPIVLYSGDKIEFTAKPEDGYALKSIVWYTDDAEKATDITAAKQFIMPDADVTVKAEFEKIVAATVNGKVTEGGVNVPDATVELYLGTVKIATTLSDKDGNYSFYNVEKGTYDIVVTKNGKVKTVLVTVDGTNSFGVNVDFPGKAISSVVEVKEIAMPEGAKADVGKIVVGGLDSIAEAQIVSAGEKVVIKLTVEPKEDENTPAQQEIKRKAGSKIVEYLDLLLTKSINDGVPVNIGGQNTKLLTIVVPFDFSNVKLGSVEILRNHNGDTESLKKNPAEGEEGFTADEKAGTITVCAYKFSDYAVAYSLRTGGSGRSGRSTAEPVSAVCPRDNTCPIDPFTDTLNDYWWHDGVHFCLEKGYMIGFPGNLFKPNDSLSRAQIVTMLWRMEGSPIVNYAMSFRDVSAEMWYCEAIRWAQSNGVVLGYNDEVFAPQIDITREQLAAILHRYAGYKGKNVSARDALSAFTDAGSISAWARENVKWAVASQMINGRTAQTLVPLGNTTRAEAAAMIYRFCESVLSK